MSKNQSQSQANLYGPILKTGKAEEFTMDIFATSRREKAAGRKGIPVCSWGEAGIGKTELPNMLVRKYQTFFGNNIVYLPMAQIEEKAELQGLPELQTIKRPLKVLKQTKLTPTLKKSLTGSEEIITETVKGKEVEYVVEYEEALDGSQTIVEEMDENGIVSKFLIDNRTIYATPSWIPQVETHGEVGLLVIDDMNRADERIINSIMQLLQDGALLGWSLPEKWEIFCTCNPEGRGYSVTNLDGAQMTRMANFTQRFDEKSWLENWAIPTGIHPIAQNYVMTHPEMVVQGERTNPRSFDKLFRMAHDTLNKVKITGDTMELGSKGEGGTLARKINSYGLMNIEEESLQSFISFLTSGYGKLPGMTEILSKEFNIKEFYAKITNGGILRVDILATLNTRLILHLKSEGDAIQNDKDQITAIRTWLKAPELPADLRYSVVDEALQHLPDIADKYICELIYARIAQR
jgi:hypothetical protein